MTLSLPSGSTADYPLQFARVFRPGDIANYPQIRIDGTPITTQVDDVDRHPDGSVKRATLSAVVPTLGTTPVTISFQDQASGNNESPIAIAQMLDAGRDFECSINVAVSGVSVTDAPVSARAWLSSLTDAGLAGQVRNNGFHVLPGYHHKGAICTTVILCDHINRTKDIGTNATKAIRPAFHCTFWGTGHVKVRPIAEIGDTRGLKVETVDLSFSTGDASPTMRDSKTAMQMPMGTWQSREYWIGTAPPATKLNPNIAYLSATLAIPNFDPSIVMNTNALASYATDWAAKSKSLQDAGYWQKAMATTGGRQDLGLFTKWDAVWLYSGDPTMRDISLRHAEFAGSWAFYFREGDAARTFTGSGDSNHGAIPSKLSRGGQFYGDSNSHINDANTQVADRYTLDGSNTNTTGWTHDHAHTPGLFYLPFLLTGDYLYWEKLQQLAAWSLHYVNPGIAYNGVGNGASRNLAIINGAQLRGWGWQMRNRGRAWYLSPDGSALKDMWHTSIGHHLQFQHGLFNVADGPTGAVRSSWETNRVNGGWFGSTLDPATNAIKFMWRHDPAYNLQSELGAKPADSSNAAVAPWMSNYCAMSYAHIVELGYTDALPLRNAFARLPMLVAQSDDYRMYLGHYVVATTKTDFSFYQNLDEIYAGVAYSLPPNMSGGKYSAGGAPNTYQVTSEGYGIIASTVLAMCADADSGAAWTGMLPWWTATQYLDHDPRYAIIPRV